MGRPVWFWNRPRAQQGKRRFVESVMMSDKGSVGCSTHNGGHHGWTVDSFQMFMCRQSLTETLTNKKVAEETVFNVYFLIVASHYPLNHIQERRQ